MATDFMTFILQTKTRSSPLGTACAGNHLQVAEVLINSGAYVDYKNGVCDYYCHHCFHTFK